MLYEEIKHDICEVCAQIIKHRIHSIVAGKAIWCAEEQNVAGTESSTFCLSYFSVHFRRHFSGVCIALGYVMCSVPHEDSS